MDGWRLFSLLNLSYNPSTSVVGFMRDSTSLLFTLNQTTMTKTVSNDYFDNNYEEVKNTPWMYFNRISFDEVMDRSSSWDPDFEGSIIRVENENTGIISEMYIKGKNKVKTILSELHDENLITHYDSETMYQNYTYGDN